MESYLSTKEFQEKVSNVGEGSQFSYRSKFDPVPTSALKKEKSSKKKKE
jgi:hypothetical protein